MVTGEIKGPGHERPGPRGAGRRLLRHLPLHQRRDAHADAEPRARERVHRPDARRGNQGRHEAGQARARSSPSEGCGGGFHECVESPLHLQSDFCAGCHQVYHYDDHFPLEATYTEWKHGPYAQKGIMCQDCHMVDHETFMRTADTFKRPERGEYRHFFSGANYLLLLPRRSGRKEGRRRDARFEPA